MIYRTFFLTLSLVISCKASQSVEKLIALEEQDVGELFAQTFDLMKTKIVFEEAFDGMRKNANKRKAEEQESDKQVSGERKKRKTRWSEEEIALRFSHEILEKNVFNSRLDNICKKFCHENVDCFNYYNKQIVTITKKFDRKNIDSYNNRINEMVKKFNSDDVDYDDVDYYNEQVSAITKQCDIKYYNKLIDIIGKTLCREGFYNYKNIELLLLEIDSLHKTFRPTEKSINLRKQVSKLAAFKCK